MNGSPSWFHWVWLPFLLLSVASCCLVVNALSAGRMSGIAKWMLTGINVRGISRSSKTAMESTSESEGSVRLAQPWVIAAYCLALILIPTTIALAKYWMRFPIYTLSNVHVDSYASGDTPGYHYWLTYSSETSGHIRFLATFCSDYQPQFEPGSTLNLLRYEDRGSCWGLKSESAGYLIRRDHDGHAIKTY